MKKIRVNKMGFEIGEVDISLIIALISVVLSLILTVANVMLVRETRIMREAQSRPDVYVQITPENDDITHINLYIGNIGQVSAYNIKLKAYPDFEYQKNKFLSELSFFKKEISYLSPNQTIKSYLIWTRAINSLSFDELAKEFNISVEYEDSNKKKYQRIYPIDLEPLRNMRSISLPSIHKNIEEIKKSLKDISRKLDG
jgi:hypothetical protein